MTENTNANNAATILSLCATTANKVKDISIKNGQLLFIHDAGRIAMDLHGKRTFYNQVVEIDSEQERLDLVDAINGKYYFVIETGVFWRYFNGWTQLTTKPEDIVFIGTDTLPELGQEKTLYVSKINKEISFWDDESSIYIVVANKSDDPLTIDREEISAMFK